MSAPEAIMRTAAKAAPAESTAKPSTISANPQARGVMHSACDPWQARQAWSTLRQGSFLPVDASRDLPAAAAQNSRRNKLPEATVTSSSQTTPKRPTTCAYCRGPLPPPAVTGRPRTFCSAQCRAANEWVVISRRREEMERREREKSEAERRAREEQAARRREREYRQAIAAGGTLAADARWERLYDGTLDKYGGRYGLCQWEDEDDGGQFTGA